MTSLIASDVATAAANRIGSGATQGKTFVIASAIAATPSASPPRADPARVRSMVRMNEACGADRLRFGELPGRLRVGKRRLRALLRTLRCCVVRPVGFGAGRRGTASAAVTRHSTVTDLARLRGWSTSVPFATAVW
jgi:hypothetical protein